MPQQPALAPDAPGIAAQVARGRHYAMTGHNQADQIAAHRAADSSRPAAYLRSDRAVSDDLAAGNLAEAPPDPHLISRSLEQQGQIGHVRPASRKIGSQPFGYRGGCGISAIIIKRRRRAILAEMELAQFSGSELKTDQPYWRCPGIGLTFHNALQQEKAL